MRGRTRSRRTRRKSMRNGTPRSTIRISTPCLPMPTLAIAIIFGEPISCAENFSMGLVEPLGGIVDAQHGQGGFDNLSPCFRRRRLRARKCGDRKYVHRHWTADRSSWSGNSKGRLDPTARSGNEQQQDQYQSQSLAEKRDAAPERQGLSEISPRRTCAI
jgi:hypothetical protein